MGIAEGAVASVAQNGVRELQAQLSHSAEYGTLLGHTSKNAQRVLRPNLEFVHVPDVVLGGEGEPDLRLLGGVELEDMSGSQAQALLADRTAMAKMRDAIHEGVARIVREEDVGAMHYWVLSAGCGIRA